MIFPVLRILLVILLVFSILPARAQAPLPPLEACADQALQQGLEDSLAALKLDQAVRNKSLCVALVDITDPENPVFVGDLPKTDGSPGATWRDIKVYKDHAFIVADASGEHGVQVFDLTRLRNVPNMPAVSCRFYVKITPSPTAALQLF